MKREEAMFVKSVVEGELRDLEGRAVRAVSSACSSYDDSIEFETPIDQAPRVGDIVRVTVEWGDAE